HVVGDLGALEPLPRLVDGGLDRGRLRAARGVDHDHEPRAPQRRLLDGRLQRRPALSGRYEPRDDRHHAPPSLTNGRCAEGIAVNGDEVPPPPGVAPTPGAPRRRGAARAGGRGGSTGPPPRTAAA